MTDSLINAYAIVAACSFVYALYGEAKASEIGFWKSSLRERLRRISAAIFLGAVGYPLMVFVSVSFLGVIATLTYVSVTGIGRVLGLV